MIGEDAAGHVGGGFVFCLFLFFSIKASVIPIRKFISFLNLVLVEFST